MQETHGLTTLIGRRMRRILLSLSIAAVMGLLFLFWFNGIRIQERQFQAWLGWVPEALLPNLIESDDFGANRYIKNLESAGAFKSFFVYDLNGRLIGGFGNDKNGHRIEILDKAGTSWGYAVFERDYGTLLTMAALAAAMLIGFLILAAKLAIKDVNRGIDQELYALNDLITEISNVFDHLSNLDSSDSPLKLNHPRFAGSLQEGRITFLFNKLVHELSVYREKVERMTTEREKMQRTQEFANIARQVAHDIRSPLTALHTLAEVLSSDVPKEKMNLLSGAIERISSIANSLVRSGLNRKDSVGNFPIQPILKQIVEEKRLEFSKVEGLSIELSDNLSSSRLAFFEPIELTRILSNLVNNSVESLKCQGSVQVGMFENDRNEIEVTIKDSGPGFSEVAMANLFKHGASFNKLNGNGLGLFHAKSKIEDWKGSIEARNVSSGGALVKFCLKCDFSPGERTSV